MITQEPTILGENEKIGENVKFGMNVIIYDNVEIGDNTEIEHNCIIGYNHLTHLWSEYSDKPQITKIGSNVLVRPNSIIYTGCELGDYVNIGSNVVMREFTKMGEHSYLGNGTVTEGYTEIGKHTAIHSLCHITQALKIEDYVFIATCVSTANGKKIGWHRDIGSGPQGATIERGARIGVGVVLLPAIRIGRESSIAAGAVVTKDIPAFKIAVGVPARVVGDVPEEERLKI